MKRNIIQHQVRKVRNAFSDRPKTMLQVAKETGIERANICRYVHKMIENNNLYLIGRKRCVYSGCMANYYTTSAQRALDHYTAISLRYCSNESECISIMRLIRAYTYSHFTVIPVDVAPNILELWRTKVKPTIDMEARR